MTKRQIIRAWKDEDYRLSLSEAELSALPAHPAGFVELSDQSLGGVAGQEEEALPTFGVICITFFYCITPPVNEWISKHLICK